MTATWIQRGRSERVVVFLNGWGMDASVLHLAPPPADWDVLMLYDYRDLRVPADALACASARETVVVVAWSMGVWAAGAVATHLEGVAGSVAVNGTARPVHAEFGIPPKAYDLTVRRFGERGRDRFYQRICGTPERLASFLEKKPARPLDEQGDELAAIPRQMAAGLPDRPFPFAKALVGREDVIFPPENQVRYWQARAALVSLNMPHLPFLDLGWRELLDHACEG